MNKQVTINTNQFYCLQLATHYIIAKTLTVILTGQLLKYIQVYTYLQALAEEATEIKRGILLN